MRRFSDFAADEEHLEGTKKQDYLNSLAMFPEEPKGALRRLIAGRFEFVQTAELAGGEEGIDDDTH